jgi:hypothetical protein
MKVHAGARARGYALRIIAVTELRQRLRRTATLVTLLVVMALSWIMISDPAGGSTLLAVNHARVLYTSSALALGTAGQTGMLFGLAGFYLLRGRAAQDLRSGVAGVIGASVDGGVLFVLGRWLGGVIYVSALLAASMITVILAHAVRGDGPIELLVYLPTYLLVFAPLVLFTASCATLFDNWAPLMGKRGDVLYFVVWMAQLALLPQLMSGHAAPSAWLFDFTGLSGVLMALSTQLDITHLSLGIADFDAAKAPLTLAPFPWTAQMAGMRLGTAALALLPLLPAIALFHRFSPDRVKPGRARSRRSPLALINGWLRPLSGLCQPAFALAARLPGPAGQMLADATLTLAAAPAAIAVLLAAQVAALVVGGQALAPLLLGCVVFWGVMISELATRDHAAHLAAMSAAVPGGATRRYWRQLGAACLLGLMFTGVAGVRVALRQPALALALVVGLFALSALASVLGRCSGSARGFLVVLLCWLYVCVNAVRVPFVDAVGTNGAANAASIAAWACAGLAAALAGHWFNRRESR